MFERKQHLSVVREISLTRCEGQTRTSRVAFTKSARPLVSLRSDRIVSDSEEGGKETKN